MDSKKAKSQIAEQLKNAGSVLVTTNNSPSVDEISATIGLTHLLLAMKKHATAVVSTDVPSTLKFLNTEEYLEDSTDRMRDFVLSFDKEKADKFRYKLVDDQVKIFITPYKTVITKDDFQFTQGDFNIDAIVVVGASKREELDPALLKEGRILHDTEILTINAGKGKQPSVGSINWIDEEASSVSEMLVSISEALGSDLLNKDSAQAFLTGIIDSTEMFSSSVTSPKVMTMAAQLMAAGADQHQIIEQLKVPAPEPVSMPQDSPDTVSQPDEDATSSDTDVDQDENTVQRSQQDNVSVDLTQEHDDQTTQPQPQPQPSQPINQPDTTLTPQSSANQQTQPKPVTTQPTATDSPPHGGYLRGEGPSGAGATSVNEEMQASSEKVLSRPNQEQSQSAAKREPHINVHPELPTIQQKQNERTVTPPTSSTPQAPQTSVNQGESQPQPATDTSDVDSARKAVEQAIASSPSPLPTPRQDTSAKPAESGGDIVIDHDGKIQQ